MDAITLTGVHKKYANWNCDLGKYLQEGDSVCGELENHFLEVMPPAFWSGYLIQMGEPNDHNGREGAPRFLTIQKHITGWIYTGVRERGERVLITARASQPEHV